MAKKANYDLTMNEGLKMSVTGETYYNGNFGIHKREDGYYILTHIPSGLRVVSAKKKKSIVKLLEDPEFALPCWESPTPAKQSVNFLSKVISRFYGEND